MATKLIVGIVLWLLAMLFGFDFIIGLTPLSGQSTAGFELISMPIAFVAGLFLIRKSERELNRWKGTPIFWTTLIIGLVGIALMFSLAYSIYITLLRM